ncbi:MAG: nucleotidyltransferase family protein [Pseudomonadales bacterium]|nr:nucleotidyltransferase family protein [Pseudomonadales bacterium]
MPLILAAGSSSRFGSDKRMFLVDGKPMLQCVAETCLSAFDQLVMVFKQEEAFEIRSKGLFEPAFLQQYQARLHYCFAKNTDRGMSVSLTQGIDYILRNFQADAVMVLLADMPYVKPQTLFRLISAYRDKAIVYPVQPWSDETKKQGHPVIFSQHYFDEIRSLQGDKGARSVITSHPEAIVAVAVNDKGVYLDIDEPV